MTCCRLSRAFAETLAVDAGDAMGDAESTFRVIFLDIDGVLNHRGWFLSRSHAADGDDITDIDPEAVARVQRIVDATDARIVISSTWRLLHERDEIRAFLRDRGLTGKIIDSTPSLPRLDRGDEIQLWLDSASVYPRRPNGIVILDDDADMGPLLPWLVRTTFERGLTDYHAAKAIEMLVERPHPPTRPTSQETANG